MPHSVSAAFAAGQLSDFWLDIEQPRCCSSCFVLEPLNSHSMRRTRHQNSVPPCQARRTFAEPETGRDARCGPLPRRHWRAADAALLRVGGGGPRRELDERGRGAAHGGRLLRECQDPCPHVSRKAVQDEQGPLGLLSGCERSGSRSAERSGQQRCSCPTLYQLLMQSSIRKCAPLATSIAGNPSKPRAGCCS